MLGGGEQVKQVLRKYGLAALGTHFIGWSICMSAIISFLGAVGPENIIHILPEGLQEHIDPTKAMGVVKFQIALAATEAIGPVRLALTLTVTPTVSKTMRKYKASRDLETMAIRFARNVVRLVKSQGAELVESVKDGGLEQLVDKVQASADAVYPALSVPLGKAKEDKDKDGDQKPGQESGGGGGGGESGGAAPFKSVSSGAGAMLSDTTPRSENVAGTSGTLKR